MKDAVPGEALDGADLAPLGLDREHQAGAHRVAVDQHGAGAADAVLAAEMGAGEAAVLAERVGERAPRLDRDRVRRAVHRERDRPPGHAAAFLSAARIAARMRCGVAGIS